MPHFLLCPSKTKLALVISLICTGLSANAAETAVGGGILTVKGGVYIGTVTRTDDRNPELIPAANASLISTPGAGVGGKNQDDGNLNFSRGDTVSTALNGRLELQYANGNFGINTSFKAWTDLSLKDTDRPWGNIPNGYTANAPLSDAGFERRARFSGTAVDLFYLSWKQSVGTSQLDAKLGLQNIDWGNRFTFAGGLSDLNPRDLPGSRRAGAAADDGRLPVPAISVLLKISPETTLDGFVQTGFSNTVLPGCGTFYSGTDFVAPGCNKAMLGAASDRATLASGTLVKRGPDVKPSGGGQYGLGIRQLVPAIGSELGVYIANYASRTPYLSGTKSQRSGAPFVPADPGGLNPTYFVEYPEDIHLLAVTLEKKLDAGIVLAELSYRPNQPYLYNALDLLNAVATLAGPTPLRAIVNAAPAGGVLHGFERYKALQMNLGIVHGLPPFLGASSANISGELVFKSAADLPSSLVARFRRSDVYGQAPVAGAACPATSSAKTCSLDGYVSQNAFAYRLRLGMRYVGILNNVDLIPSLSFGQDVRGWSEDQTISQGRRTALLSLKAEVNKTTVVELAWQPTSGGAYNNLNDRSSFGASIGYRF